MYTGITTDLHRRILQHTSGHGSKYVRARLPIKLIYSEEHASRSLASKRELQIKSWPRNTKIKKLGLEHFFVD